MIINACNLYVYIYICRIQIGQISHVSCDEASGGNVRRLTQVDDPFHTHSNEQNMANMATYFSACPTN